MSKTRKEYKPPIYVGQNLYIKPSYIVSIPEFQYETKFTSTAFRANFHNLSKNHHNGKLSSKAISNIRNAVNWLVAQAQPKRVYSKAKKSSFLFRVSFVTLTLPDTPSMVDSHFFTKKLLNNFLVYLRKYHNLKNYVWKLELQQSGKIHAHLTIDTFIHWRKLRDIWNRILSNNGLLSQFKATFGHSDPNSTDLHSVWKVKNLAAYLAKYLSKNSQGSETIKGRIWGCSYELSRANKTHIHIPANEVSEVLPQLFNKEIEYKEIKSKPDSLGRSFTFAELFFMNAKTWRTKTKGVIQKTYIDTINQLRSAAQHFTEPEFYSV